MLADRETQSARAPSRRQPSMTPRTLRCGNARARPRGLAVGSPQFQLNCCALRPWHRLDLRRSAASLRRGNRAQAQPQLQRRSRNRRPVDATPPARPADRSATPKRPCATNIAPPAPSTTAVARASRPTGAADIAGQGDSPAAIPPLFGHAQKSEGCKYVIEHEREDDRRPKDGESDRKRQRFHEDADGG